MATEAIIDCDTPEDDPSKLVIDIDLPLTKAELLEALANLSYRAQREFPRVEKFTADRPTPWTVRHRAINDLLTDLEALPS